VGGSHSKDPVNGLPPKLESHLGNEGVLGDIADPGGLDIKRSKGPLHRPRWLRQEKPTEVAIQVILPHQSGAILKRCTRERETRIP